MISISSQCYQFDTESRRSHWDRHRCWASCRFLRSDRRGYRELWETHRANSDSTDLRVTVLFWQQSQCKGSNASQSFWDPILCQLEMSSIKCEMCVTFWQEQWVGFRRDAVPELHVGPYQPGLHLQTSGETHSPPFSQCLLHTTDKHTWLSRTLPLYVPTSETQLKRKMRRLIPLSCLNTKP